MRYPTCCTLMGGALLLALFVVSRSAESADKPADLPVIEKKKHDDYTEKIKIDDNEVKFDMVAVPGGTFLMGSPKDEAGRSEDEGPQHPAAIKPFWMAKVETTWEQYDAWWQNNPGNKDQQRKALKDKADQKTIDALSRPTPAFGDPTFGFGHDGYPAIGMSHHAAMEFCFWLSQKTGKSYRLPTEAEWEWACRAGSKGPYCCDEKDLKDYAWFSENSDDSPQPVGKKKPNAWGLHDMHGNLVEWCIDQYDKDFYGTLSLDKTTLMPVKMPTDARWPHVVRGGSWANKKDGIRSASRRGSDKSWIKQDPQRPQSIWWLTNGDFVGFRVMRAVEDEAPLKGFRSKINWDSN
jgi:formylglycine-generating enzyme required for sulfatase activity